MKPANIFTVPLQHSSSHPTPILDKSGNCKEDVDTVVITIIITER